MFMKRQIFLFVAACVIALAATACKTRVPNVDYYRGPSQYRLASMQHWDRMAAREAADLLSRKSALGTLPNSEQAVSFQAAEQTEFSRVYIKMLQAELLNQNIRIASPSEKPQKTCLVETFVVGHGSVGHVSWVRYFIRHPLGFIYGSYKEYESPSTTIWTSIGNAAKFLIVGGEFGDPRGRIEMLVLTTVLDGDRPVAAYKQVVYLGHESELPLYMNEGRDSKFVIRPLDE